MGWLLRDVVGAWGPRVVWCGVVRFGVVRCVGWDRMDDMVATRGVVWLGLAWSSAVWRGNVYRGAAVRGVVRLCGVLAG